MEDELSSHLRRLNQETSAEAEQKFARGESFSLLALIFSPPAAFLKNFCLAGKLFQGSQGLIDSLLAGYRVFLIQGKLWEFETKPEKTYEKWK